MFLGLVAGKVAMPTQTRSSRSHGQQSRHANATYPSTGSAVAEGSVDLKLDDGKWASAMDCQPIETVDMLEMPETGYPNYSQPGDSVLVDALSVSLSVSQPACPGGDKAGLPSITTDSLKSSHAPVTSMHSDATQIITHATIEHHPVPEDKSDDVFIDVSDGTEDGWQQKTYKRKNTSPVKEVEPPKTRSRVDADVIQRTIYIKGTDYNIVRDAKAKPIQYNKQITEKFGAVEHVSLSKDNLRVICRNKTQKDNLLQCTELLGKPVIVSEPYCLSKSPSTSDGPNNSQSVSSGKLLKFVITGVDPEIDEQTIKENTGAIQVRRLKKRVEGELRNTTGVVLAYDSPPPPVVYLGFMGYHVHEYVPLPVRCDTCQLFGHTSRTCSRGQKCSRCGRGHSYDSCPVKDDVTHCRCVNCGGQHSAAYRGCPVYKQVKEAIKLTVSDKLSYRDALNQVKSSSTTIPTTIPPASTNNSIQTSQQTSQCETPHAVQRSEGENRVAPTKQTNSRRSTCVMNNAATQTEDNTSTQTDSNLHNDTAQTNTMIFNLSSVVFWLLRNIDIKTSEKDKLNDKKRIILDILQKLKPAKASTSEPSTSQADPSYTQPSARFQSGLAALIKGNVGKLLDIGQNTSSEPQQASRKAN